MAMNCSTNVLKEICFFFPPVFPVIPPIDVTSSSLPVPVPDLDEQTEGRFGDVRDGDVDELPDKFELEVEDDLELIGTGSVPGKLPAMILGGECFLSGLLTPHRAT